MIHICCVKKILVNNKPLVCKNIGDFNLFETTEARPTAVQKVRRSKEEYLKRLNFFVFVLFITRTGNFCFYNKYELNWWCIFNATQSNVKPNVRTSSQFCSIEEIINSSKISASSWERFKYLY